MKERKRKIERKQYNFEIVLSNGEYMSCFYIRAICKSTRMTSCINNLNAVLSELGIENIKSEYIDSLWEVTKEAGEKFSQITTELLSTSTFLNYLEEKLDEDRIEGEWENISRKT